MRLGKRTRIINIGRLTCELPGIGALGGARRQSRNRETGNQGLFLKKNHLFLEKIPSEPGSKVAECINSLYAHRNWPLRGKAMPGSITQPQNSSQLKKLMRSFLDDFDFNYFVTANFNRSTQYEAGRRILGRFQAKLDRKLFGKYYWKKQPENRTFFFAFPEVGGISGERHYHLIFRVPERRELEFEECAPEIWKKLVISGDLDLRNLPEAGDKEKVKSYICKDLWQSRNYENYLISTEFSKRQ